MELTKQQINHIFELGFIYGTTDKGRTELGNYLSNLSPKIVDNDDPEIGERFLFKGNMYECFADIMYKFPCEACDFFDTCKNPSNNESCRPKCISPARHFKLIDNNGK